MSRNDTLRVGYVVRRYPRYSETFVVREILAHEEAGLDVEIFSLRAPNDTHFQDLISRVRAPVTYVYLPAEGLIAEDLASSTLTASYFWRALSDASESLPNLWPALNEVRTEEPRHVYQAVLLSRMLRQRGIGHLHAPFASDPATVARMAARFAGIPYSFTARAKDIFHHGVRADDLRRKLRDAAGVVTVSDYHLEYLRRTFGPDAARVQRIYNGLDVREFTYFSPARRPPRVVAIGRLVEKKGLADLIEACAILHRRGRRFECRIIGSGMLRPELEARIARLNLQQTVELVGPRPQHEVIAEVQTAAALAAPCVVAGDGDRDGLPNVIQESLALGTPVVSTAVAGIAEVVRDGDTGLVVAEHDPPALAAAIERLFDDAPLRVRIAEHGRRLIEAEFDNRRTSAQRRAMFEASQRLGAAAGGAV